MTLSMGINLDYWEGLGHPLSISTLCLARLASVGRRAGCTGVQLNAPTAPSCPQNPHLPPPQSRASTLASHSNVRSRWASPRGHYAATAEWHLERKRDCPARGGR